MHAATPESHLPRIFQEALAPFMPRTAGAPEFLIDGERHSLAAVLASNADDPEFCAWAQQARPGDVFADIERAECVAAQPRSTGGELSEEDLLAIDLAYHQKKVSGQLQRDGEQRAVALDMQHLDAMRRAGL